MKRCTRCQTTKPADRFYRNRSQPDGRNGWCKDCCDRYQTCIMLGCDQWAKAGCRGLCPKHWSRWRRHGDPTVTVRSPSGTRICTVDGCPIPARCRGLCGMHYQRWRRHGDVNIRLTRWTVAA